MSDKSKYDGPIPATFMGIPVVGVDFADCMDMNAALVLDRSKTNLSPTEFLALLMGYWKPLGYIKPHRSNRVAEKNMEDIVRFEILDGIYRIAHHDFYHRLLTERPSERIVTYVGQDMRQYKHFHYHGSLPSTSTRHAVGFRQFYFGGNVATQAGELKIAASYWSSERCICDTKFHTGLEIDVSQVVKEPIPVEVRSWAAAYRADPTCVLAMYDWFAERGYEDIAVAIEPYRHEAELGHILPPFLTSKVLDAINKHFRPRLLAIRKAMMVLRSASFQHDVVFPAHTSVEREYFLPLPPQEEGDKP